MNAPSSRLGGNIEESSSYGGAAIHDFRVEIKGGDPLALQSMLPIHPIRGLTSSSERKNAKSGTRARI